MYKTLFSTTAVLALVASQALGQTNFSAIDANGDRVLSYEEMVATFGVAGADALVAQSDSNGDRSLSIAELTKGKTEEDDDDDD